jgi:osmotically inducible protein OsmC
MATRKSTVVWEGGLRSGKGVIKSDSGILNTACSFGSRFESNSGSNPEELLAAATASCYSMTLSSSLEKAGSPASRLETQAACTIDKVGEAYRITVLKLTVRCTASNIDAAGFQRLAQEAKETCPVALALRGGVRLELDCKLI